MLGTPTPLVNNAMVPLLDESKLYALARSKPLLEFLTPDINTQMAVELKVEEIFPREEADGDDTRILINFTTATGSEALYKVNNKERLDRRFPIDNFMNGFMAAVDNAEPIDGAMDPVDANILAALNMATIITMGLTSGEAVSVSEKVVAEVTFKSITSILFNDPLDIMLMINEAPELNADGESTYIITKLWTVKQRPIAADAVLEQEPA